MTKFGKEQLRDGVKRGFKQTNYASAISLQEVFAREEAYCTDYCRPLARDLSWKARQVDCVKLFKCNAVQAYCARLNILQR